MKAKSCIWDGVTPCNSTGRFAEKDLEVLVDKSNTSQQCAFAAKKVGCILGGVSKSVASRLRQVIIPFCLPLVRLLWAYCVQFGDPQYKKGTDTLEQVQRRVTKMVWRWRISILGEIKNLTWTRP